MTAATVAAMLDHSVSAIDKVYNWWRTKQGDSPASIGLPSDPKNQVLEYVSLTGPAQPDHVVMTYSELAALLTPRDVNLIQSFEKRMNLAMTQWEALNANLPLAASAVERVRIEANMQDIKDKDICSSLKQIVDFIGKLGIDLQDHYASVRTICPPNLMRKP